MLSITYRQPVLTPGKEVTLSLSNPYGETSTHLFHWTVETQAPVQEATLTDQEGTMVGTGFFSPFSACVTLQKGDTLDPDALLGKHRSPGCLRTTHPGFQLSGVEGDPPLSCNSCLMSRCCRTSSIPCKLAPAPRRFTGRIPRPKHPTGGHALRFFCLGNHSLPFGCLFVVCYAHKQGGIFIA